MQTMMKPKSIVFYPIISHLSLIEISEFIFGFFKKVSFIRNWILQENTVEKQFVLNRAFFAANSRESPTQNIGSLVCF